MDSPEGATGDIEIDEEYCTAGLVRVVSCPVPFTIGHVLTIASMLPEGAVCEHVEFDGDRIYGTWSSRPQPIAAEKKTRACARVALPSWWTGRVRAALAALSVVALIATGWLLHG